MVAGGGCLLPATSFYLCANAELDVRQSCALCHRVSLHLLCEPPGAIALVSVCPSPPACFAPSSITLIRLLNEW